MGLKNYLIKKLFIGELEDVEVSEKVEDLLKKGLGQKFVLAFNELPLFFTSNLETIQNKTLRNNGSVQIITRETYKINEFPINIKGNVEIYQSPENLELEFAVLSNGYFINYYNKQKETFSLWKSSKVAQSYISRFDRMKANSSLDIIKQEKLTPATFR